MKIANLTDSRLSTRGAVLLAAAFVLTASLPVAAMADDPLGDEAGRLRQAQTASVASSNTDGSSLAQQLASHFASKRVAYRFEGSASEPPQDLSVLVCPDGSFVYRDHLAKRPGNIGEPPPVRHGRWRILSRSGRGIVELAFADGESVQYDAMVRGGQTYIDGERVHLSDAPSDCKSTASSQISIAATTPGTAGAAADWKAFLPAFRTAVQRRDRVALQQMMCSRFDYGNARGVPPQKVFAELDYDDATNWRILDKTLSQPVKSFSPPGTERPMRSAFHPAPCGEGCRFQSEVVFEFDQAETWCWKAMTFPGD